MGQVLLVRHGQASWGADDYDLLSPLGWEQSRMLGHALAARATTPDLLVQGGMRRHRETASAVVEKAGWEAMEVVNDGGWNEFDHVGMLAAAPDPEFAGSEPTAAEFQGWFEAATDRWTSGGTGYSESYAEFAERIGAALARTTELAGASSTAVVFTSGGAISWVAASLLTGSTSPDPATTSLWGQLNKVVVNTSITKVVTGRRGATLVSFNEHSHLEGGGLTYR
ncbi:histidine phosphatase family protein [Nocardioides donggukensis]|uniref:Histidine phosphatase family protein n=1 Tax=Nocardioides donggukensis TaxID=2774019 RepID=A0A927Q0X6_9ACTN|nr:histidine phosphatase family protein [Nocardioides donggukensis]MBD8871140.1 histidine phosphatase family protein [Nocardioides donggukensis]